MKKVLSFIFVTTIIIALSLSCKGNPPKQGNNTNPDTITIAQPDTSTTEPTVGDSVNRTAVLLEYFTGQACGNCPEGIRFVNDMISSLPNPEKVALVAHHTGYYDDDFTIAESLPLNYFFETTLTYAPATMLDRTYLRGKAVITEHYFITRDVVENQLKTKTCVTINLSHTYDADSKELKVDVSGRLLEKNEHAKLNIYLIQDGIEAYQSYGGNNSYAHKNAIRASLTGSWGAPLGVTIGDYSQSFTYSIPEYIKGVKNKPFATDVSNMYLVAFIADVTLDTTVNIYRVSNYEQARTSKVLNSTSLIKIVP